MAWANEQFLLLLEIDGAAQVRADGRKGIDLIAFAAHQPDPAHHVVGMERPGVAADVTNYHLLGFADRQVTQMSYRLEIVGRRRAVASIDDVGQGWNAQERREQA